MEAHLRRFHILHQQGRWQEALQQILVTLSCTTDRLNEPLRALDEFLGSQDGPRLTIPLPLTDRCSQRAHATAWQVSGGWSRRLTGCEAVVRFSCSGAAFPTTDLTQAGVAQWQSSGFVNRRLGVQFLSPAPQLSLAIQHLRCRESSHALSPIRPV